MLEKIFKLKKHGTNVGTELLAGVITFLTMSYILVVNPDILSATGMDKPALFTSTALTAILGTLFMAFIANVPIAQAAGMGLNNFFAFTVVISMGYSWEMALTAVFIEGLIFIALTFFNVRELIVKSIPKTIKTAIPVGIGLFITLIGLNKAGIIVNNEHTMVTLGDMSNPNVWVALIGIFIIGALMARKVHAAIFIGILISTIAACFFGLVEMPEGGKFISTPPSIAPIFAKFEWHNVFTIDMLVVVLTFLFVNLFDTVGTLLGVMSKTGMADKDGNFPQLKAALFADALGTTFGAILGNSTVTSYVESSAGVASGGRTGLTAVSVAIMFLLALFFAPVFLLVPASASAPALIIVGLLMVTSVIDIDFKDITESLPAFFTFLMMPFAYSIAEGIVFGISSYVILKVLSGKVKSINITTAIIFITFIIKFVFDALK